MRILVKVVYPSGIEAAGPALNAVDHVAFLQEELRKIAAVLTGDTGDQGSFGTRNFLHLI